MTRDVALVVPCFNEERRLQPEGFRRLLDDPSVRLLFVDDGSTDGTRALLQELAAPQPERVEVLALPRNQGKAEAVRHGMRAALRSGARIVGYLDADLATPPEELLRLLHAMQDSSLEVLVGARVGLLGRAIERNKVRHYAGRAFATAASLVLRLHIYDTQCGAKLFRNTPALAHALDEPFLSTWAFDVELIGRLLAGGPGAPPLSVSAMAEEPLRAWRDVHGSALRLRDFVKAGGDLVRIERDLARRRRRRARSAPPA